MEQFQDGQHVRLRSRACGGYVLAAADGVRVILTQHRAVLNAAWVVHVYYRADGDGPYLLLHSAASGRYLAATFTPRPRGRGLFGVVQRNYDQPEVRSIMWQVQREVIAGGGFPNDVRLRIGGGLYLHVDGSFPTLFYWIVEPIPAREDAPPLPPPFSVRPRIAQAESPAWRLIRFRLYTDHGWSQFLFRGRRVCILRNDLAWLLNLPPHRRHALVMCVRAGRYGRLTPLVVDLPRGGSGETLELVVMLSGTPAYNALRHPDMYAE